MKKILLPVDFSPHSENACRYVAALSEDLSMKVELFHSHYDPIMDSDLPDYGFSEKASPTPEEQLTQKARRDMEEMKLRLVKEFDADTQLVSRVTKGRPDKEILKAAERLQADFIVMGTRGKGKGVSSFFGSVTARVMKQGDRPVLGIPADARYSGIRNVLYASDFDDFDGKALSDLMELMRPLVMRLYCVHLYDEADRQLVGGDLQALQEKLEEHIREDCPHGNVEFLILQGKNLIEVLDGFIQAHDIDLLAMTTRHRNFVTQLLEPSIVKRMLFHTHTPMLTFHSESIGINRLLE